MTWISDSGILGEAQQLSAVHAQGSALRALAASNTLIRREIGSLASRKGETVEVYLLENGGIA